MNIEHPWLDLDEFGKTPLSVIPAKAGIQHNQKILDAGSGPA
jgi:hypothetical protein